MAGKPRLKIGQHVLELRITNQIIHASPSVEQTQEDVISDLHAYLGIVCRLPRIRGSRFNITAMEASRRGGDDYGHLLSQAGDLGELLQATYRAIMARMGQVKAYVQTWYSYQALWDLSPQKVYSLLGDDLSKWRQLVVEINDSRKYVVAGPRLPCASLMPAVLGLCAQDL